MKNINVNLKIEVGNLRKDEVKINYVPTGLTSSIDGTEYIEINQYSKRFNQSVSTIRRRLKKIGNKECYKYYLILNGKYYVSPLLKTIDEIQYSEKDCLKGNYYTYLNQFTWHLYGCVAFENELSVITVKERMNSYFNKLVSKMTGIELRMFYVTEKNPSRGGYHSHFLLKVGNESKLEEFMNVTKRHFIGKGKKKYADLRIDPYYPDKGGIAYLLKEIHQLSDGYDLLVHNAD